MAKPFLKWVGGKQALLPVYEPYLPKGKIPYYAEPFVGGGAMYFHLAGRISEMAILADNNHHLINTYKHVRDHLSRVTAILKGFHGLYRDANKGQREEMYYSLRKRDRHHGWDWATAYAAARFIFINKTGYNGLWRVNQSGQCNTPHGKYNKPTICDDAVIRDASEALYRVLLWHLDFNTTIDRILTMGQIWDTKFFVYLDPPYVPVGDQSFTSYTAEGWSDVDTELLAVAMAALDIGGHRFMCSNSPGFLPVIEQWQCGYDVKHVTARRKVNRDPDGRGEVAEVLVRNYG